MGLPGCGKVRRTWPIFSPKSSIPHELYAAEEVPAVYQAGFQQANAVVQAVVRALVENRSGRLRILEVGAGYGSTTQAILPILPPAQTNYCFTDVSPFFLQHAQAQFAAYPFMQYNLLDLETPPNRKGTLCIPLISSWRRTSCMCRAISQKHFSISAPSWRQVACWS